MYYSNETVINALISLKMKAYFLSLKGEHMDCYKSSIEILRLVVVDMGKLQKLLLMNCVEALFRNNSYFLGY